MDGGFAYANELVTFLRQHYGAIALGGRRGLSRKSMWNAPILSWIWIISGAKWMPASDFLITQLFFDNGRYWDFCERAQRQVFAVPILPGIMPITNAAQVDRWVACGASLPSPLAAELEKRRADPQAVVQLGVAHATAQCIDLLRGGSPGIHFYTLNRSTATKDVFSELRVAGLA